MHLNDTPIRLLRKAFSGSLLFILLLLLSSSVRAQVSVFATAGTTGPTSYTTLKGAFDAINLGTHQGSITVTITASTTETATAALNASGSGGASYTKVLVKPGTSTTPTVSGAIASAPVIKLNGANNVIIDGSGSSSGSRDLTISNTSTTAPQAVVIGSVGTTPVTSDTLKNCTIINGVQTSSALVVSDATSPATAGYFSNIAIINNSIQKAYIGLYMITAGGTNNGGGTYVAKNSLNTSGTNAIRCVGIYAQALSGAKVDSNTVGNFEAATGETDRGIWLASGTINSSVTGNTVTNLSYTGTSIYAPIGINITPATTSSGNTIIGNIITNLTSSGTATTTGINFISAASGVTISKNQVSSIKNTNTGGYGAAGIMLASTLNTAATNVINNFVWGVTGYGTNLWTSDANGNGIVADGGGGYNIYHNTVWLNVNQTATTGTRAAAVFISSGVTTANSINLRNNLLVNTQTVGNANSRMALVITANTNVMSTFNYNDYYSTSGNLAGQGTNPTIWNTIAQIQTNMGLNANSVSIQPTFASTTDLHLPTASNTALNNLGVNLSATVPDDIDNETRTTTPDMGADEFGNCQTVTITGQPSTAAFCAGGNTSLTVAATNGNLFQWQVNTGSGFTNIANGGVYSGATSGTLAITAAAATMNGYIYRAQVSYGASCPQTASNSVALIVNPRPSVALSMTGPTTFCTGGTDTLSVPVAANVIYQWWDGTTALGGANTASYVATASGNYQVIATNNITGCADTSVQTVITVGTGPAAVISPAGASAICQGGSITLSAGTTPGVNYQWKQNGSPISGATGNTYAATSGGSYTVDVSTNPTCVTSSAAVTITVYPLPIATSTASSYTICQGKTTVLSANPGSTLSYQWLSNNSPISGATGMNYNATLAATYRVIVKNTITSCQDTSAGMLIKVNPLPAAAITPTAPPAICERDTTLFSANTGVKLAYQWQTASGGIIGNANASQYKAYQSGTYSVVVTDSNGCQKLSNAVPLLVHPAPIAMITYSSPLEFCEGSAVAMAALAAPNLSYQWIKDGNDIYGLTQPNQTIAASGVYTVRVVDNFNCKSLSDPVSVTVYPTPVPVISYNNGTLGTGSYKSYQWYLDNNPIGIGGNATSYTPGTVGAYKVVVEDNNGCTGTSELFFLMSLSTGSLSKADAQMLVYPNPATAAVTVENRSGLKMKALSIVNTTGAVVKFQEAAGNKERISLDALAAGLYYLRIETDGGVLLKKLQVMR